MSHDIALSMRKKQQIFKKKEYIVTHQLINPLCHCVAYLQCTQKPMLHIEYGS